MEKEFSGKPASKVVITSEVFETQRIEIYQYTTEVWSETQAERYINSMKRILAQLETSYLMYPECPYLPTRDHRYRNILLPAHRIIYRVRPKRVEVLAILHFASSVNMIRKTRSIQI